VSYGVWDSSAVPYGARVSDPLAAQPRSPTVGASAKHRTTRYLTDVAVVSYCVWMLPPYDTTTTSGCIDLVNLFRSIYF
jgi:hypothetical protein